MNVHLYTLGKLRLETTTFQEQQPLLLLTYLAVQGKTLRGELADLLWANRRSEERLPRLSEALYRLRKVSTGLVRSDGQWLETSVTTDVQAFRRALEQGDSQHALKHYQGHFLEDLERNKRVPLGEELTEWIVNTREALYTEMFAAKLSLAEREAFAGNFLAGATLAWGAYRANTDITYPSERDFQRLYWLLLAADSSDLESLKQEALEIYGSEPFHFASQPFEARSHLTHTHSSYQDNVLVDRETELATLLELCSKKHLISVVGPAGIGKTELAKALARASRGQPFAKDGIYLVYLESLPAGADTSSVLTLVAETLGLPPKANLTSEDLVHHLADSHTLLILDNFEQLLPKHLPFLGELLRCPNLRVLVTSREVLSLKHEHRFRLGNLAYPKEKVTLKEARRYPAIQLFEERAKLHDITLTENTLPHVLRLCQWVEGLPLALQLVTAWLGTLSLEQLGHAVGKLELLSQGSHDTPRHQSIHLAFDYSLELLSKSQREAFVKLAVFGGGFNLAAATALGVPVTMLRSLVEKSLLRFEAENARYSFHPLLHQYARELLERDANLHEVKTSHANYFLDELMAVTNGSSNDDKARATKYMGENLENLSAAWNYATARGWLDRLFEACKPLQHFGDSTARYGFAAELLAFARVQSQSHAAAYVALTSNLGYLRYRLGRYQEAIELAEESLGRLDALDIPKERKLSLLEQGYVTQYASYSSLGEFEKGLLTARGLHDVLYHEVPGSLLFGTSLVNLAIFEETVLGVYDLERLEKALGIFERGNHLIETLWALVTLGGQLVSLEKLVEAKRVLTRAEMLAHETAMKHWLFMSHYHQARLAKKCKDYPLAKSLCQRLIVEAKVERKLSLLARVCQLLGSLTQDSSLAYQKRFDFLDEALVYASQVQDITLINSILIDTIYLHLEHGNIVKAREIFDLIYKDTGRVLSQDLNKLQHIQQTYGWHTL
jgi:predicted ATPase